MNIFQQKPFSSTPTESPLTTSNQPKKKWFLIFGFILLIVTLSITSYIYFVYLPEKAMQEYVNSARTIVSRLNEEVSSFKQNNFLAAKNIKTNIPDAQAALEKHRVDFNNTRNNTASLHTEYTKLKPAGKTKELDQLVTKQFNLVEEVLDKYGKDLIFRKQVFAAFGEQFPQTLNNFAPLFYKGGEKVDFILLTDKISNLAQQTLYALNNLSVPQDEKEEYNYRKSYVEDIKIGFDKLNEYYRTGNDQDINKSVEELSKKIADSNRRYEAIVDSYTSNSSVALGLKQFESQSQQIQNYFEQYLQKTKEASKRDQSESSIKLPSSISLVSQKPILGQHLSHYPKGKLLWMRKFWASGTNPFDFVYWYEVYGKELNNIKNLEIASDGHAAGSFVTDSPLGSFTQDPKSNNEYVNSNYGLWRLTPVGLIFVDPVDPNNPVKLSRKDQGGKFGTLQENIDSKYLNYALFSKDGGKIAFLNQQANPFKVGFNIESSKNRRTIQKLELSLPPTKIASSSGDISDGHIDYRLLDWDENKIYIVQRLQDNRGYLKEYLKLFVVDNDSGNITKEVDLNDYHLIELSLVPKKEIAYGISDEGNNSSLVLFNLATNSSNKLNLILPPVQHKNLPPLDEPLEGPLTYINGLTASPNGRFIAFVAKTTDEKYRSGSWYGGSSNNYFLFVLDIANPATESKFHIVLGAGGIGDPPFITKLVWYNDILGIEMSSDQSVINPQKSYQTEGRILFYEPVTNRLVTLVQQIPQQGGLYYPLVWFLGIE